MAPLSAAGIFYTLPWHGRERDLSHSYNVRDTSFYEHHTYVHAHIVTPSEIQLNVSTFT